MSGLREAWRGVRAAPIVSVVAILSLALGIGANTAIFSIINSLMLRPLPVHRPDRLAVIATGDEPVPVWSYPLWEQIRARSDLFESAAAWAPRQFNIASRGRAMRVEGLFVSGSFFSMLGLQPAMGRLLGSNDDAPGAEPSAVVSYDFWKRHFGGSDRAIGQTIALNGKPHTIAGVAPPGFFGPEVGTTFDVAVTFAREPLIVGKDSFLAHRAAWWLTIAIRQRDDQTHEAAEAALRAIQPQLRDATMPPEYNAARAKTYLDRPFNLRPASRGLSPMRASYRRPMLTLMAVVTLLLLIACANIANLLLARGTARRHELSVRLALGASRMRLIRQLGSESALLAGAGAVLGLVLAAYGSRVLVSQLSAAVVGAYLDVSLDWRVLSFTAALAMLTALVFGITPAFQITGVGPGDALKWQGRATAGLRRFSAVNAIVVTQIALSLMLLFAAGLFLRTFVTLTSRPTGLDRDRILVSRVDTTSEGENADRRLALYERLRLAAASVPGVESASLSAMTPLNGQTWQLMLEWPDGRPVPEADRVVVANMIDGNYFSTFGTRLIAGRTFTERDGRNSPGVAIVNRAFVAKYLGGSSPIGTRIRQGGFWNRPAVDREIVGLVEDVVYRGPRDPDPPTVYLPLAQRPQPPPVVIVGVRAAQGVPARLLEEHVTAALSRADANAALTPSVFEDQFRNALVQERMIATLSAFFGALAVLLAGLGLYGVTLYGVNRRKAEIGIRIALGAAPSRVVSLVLGRVAAQTAVGIAIGAVASVWLSRYVTALLYGVEPADPATLVAAASILSSIAFLAGWLPARTASVIDPAKTLRD